VSHTAAPREPIHLDGERRPGAEKQRDHAREEQRVSGAYTVSDVWTFVEAWVTALVAEML
jgi:hypothetical protein